MFEAPQCLPFGRGLGNDSEGFELSFRDRGAIALGPSVLWNGPATEARQRSEEKGVGGVIQRIPGGGTVVFSRSFFGHRRGNARCAGNNLRRGAAPKRPIHLYGNCRYIVFENVTQTKSNHRFHLTI